MFYVGILCYSSLFLRWYPMLLLIIQTLATPQQYPPTLDVLYPEPHKSRNKNTQTIRHPTHRNHTH
ncbi:hypothetical protein L211DRAFT_840792 [Terfezia boudieri ATCC MYA-4762]|uniref:Uncharacterized protein n=1 Tax=Terfezia boudieri ATCC MYA-4762 TaxID=1051890 RepID=A0A3N4LEP7_9PEZI|nr:hypothetical protein L211DRAFT_840792 [Terfezia boudieri ATCC MYA-4762]